MKNKNSIAHVIYDCKYHVVIIPKYRYNIFTKNIKLALKDEIKIICNQMKIGIIQGNISKDHIHLCLSIPPKVSISNTIGTIKGKVAIRMFNRFPDLRKKYWGSHFWSQGYYVNTVGINEYVIREYIKNQNKLDRLENQGKLF